VEYRHILFTKQENCLGYIVLNRPTVYNALDLQTWAEIRRAVRVCRFDSNIKVVVITGAGGVFAAGSDVHSLNRRTTTQLLKSEAHASLRELEALEKPVIAAIDGFAIGSGCELALACDIRIATKRAKLGFPETSLGIIPGAGGTQRLQRIIGYGKAKELILTGEIINASLAQKIGLINRLVEHSTDLLPTVRQIAVKIASHHFLALSLAKLLLNQSH